MCPRPAGQANRTSAPSPSGGLIRRGDTATEASRAVACARALGVSALDRFFSGVELARELQHCLEQAGMHANDASGGHRDAGDTAVVTHVGDHDPSASGIHIPSANDRQVGDADAHVPALANGTPVGFVEHLRCITGPGQRIGHHAHVPRRPRTDLGAKRLRQFGGNALGQLARQPGWCDETERDGLRPSGVGPGGFRLVVGCHHAVLASSAGIASHGIRVALGVGLRTPSNEVRSWRPGKSGRPMPYPRSPSRWRIDLRSWPRFSCTTALPSPSARGSRRNSISTRWATIAMVSTRSWKNGR